ncbi:MAG: choice-of-anchor V domain-containing protein [bacterium]
MARRLLSYAIVITLLVIAAATGQVRAYPTGPPDGFTGAPGEGTCMTCHINGAGDGALQILGVPPVYGLNKIYHITVQLEDPGQFRWGFEITALDGGNNKAGSFTITDATHTQLSTNPPSIPDYVKQTLAGTYTGTNDGPVSWTFDWQCPDTTTGPIMFYAAANTSQNTGTPAGFNYTATAMTHPGIVGVPLLSNSALALLIGALILIGGAMVYRRTETC